MNPNQTQVFSELITAVHAFYRRDISEYAVQIWWNAMRPYDFEAVKHAINRHCVNPDNGQFCPMPADIVKLLQGSTRDSALLAWSKVDKALRHIGTYRSVAFDDPIIHLVLQDMGGWITLGNKTEKDWPFVAKEFENRYRGYKQRDDVEAPKWLTGIAECENSVNGFDEEEVVLIGDEREARKVVRSRGNRKVLRYSDVSKVVTELTP